MKLDANKQLQLVDYFGPPNANWLWRRDLDVNVTPVVFDYRGTKFLVGTSKECRLWLLDRDALGGEDHRTALDTTPLICNDAQAFDARGVWGALGAWQDERGTQWVLVPFWGPVSTEFKAPIEHARPTGAAWPRSRSSSAPAVAADAGLVVARHGPRRRDRHRQWRRVCLSARRDAAQTTPDAAWDEPGGPGRRRAQFGPRAPHPELAPRRALRARRPDRQGTVVDLLPIAGPVGTGLPAANGTISSGAVVALQVQERGGAWSLQPGWVSHDQANPSTPIVVNGVVFALASGPAGGAPAVVEAYDGATGSRLWTSGTSITSPASPGSFWTGLGQIYLGATDGTLYAFGFDDERRHIQGG